MKKLLVSFLLMVSLVLSPAVSFAFSTQDYITCFKLVSGIKYGELVLKQAAGVLNVAFTKPQCHAQLMSEDPLFYTMMGTTIALKLGKAIDSKGECQNLLNGIVDQAVGTTILNENVANLTPEQQAQLKSAASDEIKKGISSIPGMQYWDCACEYAWANLMVSDIQNIMKEGKESLKICGDVTGINSVVSWAAKWLGLGCPDDKKITRDQFITKVLMRDDGLKKYALMNYEERESQCMRSTSPQYLGCMYYYTGGPKACRMDNANPQCDDIMKTFRQMVLDYQNTIVKEAIASCSKVADGCKGENNLPLVIDTYGLLPTGDCLNKGIKNFSPDCKPKEQPCCKIAPVGPIRCDKAKSQAANQMGSGFRAIVEQAFGKVTETYANDKMKADLKSCRDTILGGLLASVQSFACNAAMALPEATYDISVIWPGVLQQATDKAVADDKGNCIGPYVHMQKYGECVYKCNPSIALGTTYNTADPSIVNCKNNCKATYFVPQGILDLKETTPAGTTSVPIPSSDKTKEIGTKQPMPEMRKPKDIKPIEPIKPIPAPVPVPGVR